MVTFSPCTEKHFINCDDNSLVFFPLAEDNNNTVNFNKYKLITFTDVFNLTEILSLISGVIENCLLLAAYLKS